jgi:hypothetical protein
MTREERAEELTRLRQSNPARLIRLYRSATNTPLLANLPRGLGFTGMIAAILDSEFPLEPLPEDTQEYVPLNELFAEPSPALSEPPTPVRRWDRVAEFKALCSGAAMVFAGLLMAVMYFILTSQFPV